LAFWPCYSYSDPFTYGTTGNAAADSLSWGMGTLVPSSPGLSINGVIYRYTAVKNPDDSMLVHIQNKDASGNGYIFRETDDWSGLPGLTINKLVSVNNVPIGRWGDGSIEVEGIGQVVDPTVIYTYRVDECFSPQSNPTCPGYVSPTAFVNVAVTASPYDPMTDEAVLGALDATDSSLYEDDEDDESIENEKLNATKDKFERGMAAAQNALTLANGFTQAKLISAMNMSVNMNPYYATTIRGGTYKETTQLIDSELPDHPRGLRNGLAQQLLHEQMVSAQYNN